MAKISPDTKRARQKIATRAKCLRAAEKTFHACGYESATMRGIAKAAGLSTGALFANWPGKAELYREVFGHAPLTPEHGLKLLGMLGVRPASVATFLREAGMSEAA